MPMTEFEYLIVAGTTKAGTTSVFKYLSDHPQICASSVKETRFFVDRDYPVPAKYRLEDGLDRYQSYFGHCPRSRVRMEATPDYLYSAGTAHRIRQTLPWAKLVFILRHPVDRLVSWYRFAMQTGKLPRDASLEDYVERQLQPTEQGTLVEQHMRALEQGRYSVYLEPYYTVFPEDQLRILDYRMLKETPLSVMNELCRFAGINSSFYDNYDFKVFNRTQAMKWPFLHGFYMKTRRWLGTRVNDKTGVRMALKRIRHAVEPVYLRVNKGIDTELTISESLKTLLASYYRDGVTALLPVGGEYFDWEIPVMVHRARDGEPGEPTLDTDPRANRS